MKKKPLSDEEQLDELLVELQKKFLSGDPHPASDRKKTKEEIDDEKFQAQLAAMLGSLSASSQKIKKTKKKVSVPLAEPAPVETPPAEEELPPIEEASPSDEPTPSEEPVEEVASTPITSVEKKPRKKSARPKKQPVEKPMIEEPIVEEPIVEEPFVEEPFVEEPFVKEPFVKEPFVEEPFLEEPINSTPIVIKPRVRVIPPEPQRPDAGAIRITSPTSPKGNEPIRIVPRQKAEGNTQPSRHADAIVIRPKAYPTANSEPIVIKPRVVERARPIPQKQNPAPMAQPIKIGKEKSNDPDA